MTLLELLQLMKKHLKLVVALPVIAALFTAVVSFVFIPNTYTASTSMYVLSNSSTTSNTLTNSDLSASQMLTNDVATLVKSDRVKKEAASNARVSSADFEKYSIKVENSTTTRLITISVTGTDSANVAAIANGVAAAADNVARETMGVEAINVIDQASTPTDPSGPNRKMYIAVAFLAGLFVAIAIIVILDMLDTRVRKPEELEDLLGVPVIGKIPVMK